MDGFEAIWSLGCMSGTSMDGVDAAMLLTDGERICAFGKCSYRPYSTDEIEAITAAQGLWQDEKPDVLHKAEETVRRAHLEVISSFHGAEITGFHGQTVAHAPELKRTHQIGNGKRLADESGQVVVWDFRTRDMAHGGEGAPLAPVFHFACAKWLGETHPVVFLNLGGVANLTFVDPLAPEPEAPGALIAFDTGPANALIDDLMARRRNQGFDKGGELAATGKSDRAIVDDVLSRPYFDRTPPKSLDRNEFIDVLNRVESLPDSDAAATLTALSAAAIAHSEQFLPAIPSRFLAAGGGSKNRTLMSELRTRLSAPVSPVEDVGLNSDMLEAQAFAFLAVRSVRGLALSVPSTTGCSGPTKGGRIDEPRSATSAETTCTP